MEIKFSLYHEKGKPWIKTENGYFSGNVFFGDKCLTETEIKCRLDGLKTIEEARKFAAELNGSFAWAITIDDAILLVVDRQRTIPLFFEINNNAVTIYNHISMDDITTHGINEAALRELDSALFVSGDQTMAQNVFSVMAGEAVVIRGNSEVSRQYYHDFIFEKVTYNGRNELLEQIDRTFIEVTKRLIQFLNGRCAVIPLSGGHDSRLLVYYLKQCGYNNILTYTYGPKDNFEATTSKKVADYLGLNWVFVEYHPRQLQKLFKAEFEKLTDYYSNGVSSVCIQDWYAVNYLQQNGYIPNDSVFVPGHSFDAIAGSFILPRYVEQPTVCIQDLVKDIIWKHYSEGKYTLSHDEYAYFSDLIHSSLLKNSPESLPAEEAFRLYQIYNIRERQAKYICTQVKIYEYYGYDWYLPLWDKELIAFWEGIGLKEKFERKLFFDFTDYKYHGLMESAPVLNPKSKMQKKKKHGFLYRAFQKIKQLIYYVDFHYCLAYFSRLDLYKMFAAKRFLNIGIFVNYKIKNIIRSRVK